MYPGQDTFVRRRAPRERSRFGFTEDITEHGRSSAVADVQRERRGRGVTGPASTPVSVARPDSIGA